MWDKIPNYVELFYFDMSYVLGVLFISINLEFLADYVFRPHKNCT